MLTVQQTRLPQHYGEEIKGVCGLQLESLSRQTRRWRHRAGPRAVFRGQEASWFVNGNESCCPAPLYSLSAHLFMMCAETREISSQLPATQTHPFLAFCFVFYLKSLVGFWGQTEDSMQTRSNAALQGFFRLGGLKLTLLPHKRLWGKRFYYSIYCIWCGQRSRTLLFRNFCFLLSTCFFQREA